MMQLERSPTNPSKRCFQTLTTSHGSVANDDNIISKQPKLIEVENVSAPFVSHRFSFYQPSKVDHVDLKVKLESLRFKFEVQLFEMQISPQNQHKDSKEKHEILTKRLSNDHSIIISCIDELGLLCAFEAVKICMANTMQAVKQECDFFQESFLQCFYFLKDALCIIEKCLPNGHENILDAGCDYEKMVAAGYISPKLHQLFYLFQSFGEATKELCLIFVESVMTAKVLDRIVKRAVDLSHLKVSYWTSKDTSVDAMSPTLQKKTLESLYSGKVNLLFVADAVDDGVDMPECSTVICFDIPKTARSNVQSQGWACQSAFQFITMLERGNAKQREHICNIIQSKHSMLDSPQRRDPDTSAADHENFKETELHYVEERGMLKKTQREGNKDMEIDNQDNNKDQGNRDGETTDQNNNDKMSRDRETAKRNSKDQENRDGEADNQNSKDQESGDGETAKQESQDQENRERETDNQNNIISETTPEKPDSNRNTKITLFGPEPSTKASTVDECSMKETPMSKLEIPVLKSINMEKGGPRISLFELCKQMQWPMPSFTSTEKKSRSLMEIGEGANKRMAYNSYESLISLTIPDCCVVELMGHACADKKSSFDSAALLMLYELQKLGKVKLG